MMATLTCIRALWSQAGAALRGLRSKVVGSPTRQRSQGQGRPHLVRALAPESSLDRIAGVRGESGRGRISLSPIITTPGRERRERCLPDINNPRRDSRRRSASEAPRRAASGLASRPGGGDVRAWLASCAISLLTALFVAAPASAQTLTATHPYGGPLYEGDKDVTITITGFTIAGECSKIGLNLVTGNSSDFVVSSELSGQPCDSTRTDARFNFTFEVDSGDPHNKTLVHELYSVDKTDSTETIHGRFTLTITNGLRPAKISLNMPTSGGGSDPKRGINLRESSTGVKIEVWLTAPPPDEDQSARVTFSNKGQTRWGGTGGTNSSVSKFFTKDNYANRQTVILRPVPDDNSDDWVGKVTVESGFYYYLPKIEIPVTVIDETAPSVFDTNRLTLVESGPAKSYTVKLGREPVEDVTLVTKAHTHLRFKGPGDSAFGEQTTLTFTKGVNGTWKTPQTIEVKHILDSDGDNEKTLPIVHEPGPGTKTWHLSTKDLPVTLTDAGNVPIFSRDSVPVIEGGPAETYTVKLERDPGQTVTLTAEVPPGASGISASASARRNGRRPCRTDLHRRRQWHLEDPADHHRHRVKRNQFRRRKGLAHAQRQPQPEMAAEPESFGRGTGIGPRWR